MYGFLVPGFVSRFVWGFVRWRLCKFQASRVLSLTALEDVYRWAGVGWDGMGWDGLEWAELCCAGLEWAGMGCAVLFCAIGEQLM